MSNLPKQQRRYHVFFIIGAIIFACGITPALLWIYELNRPVPALIALAIGIVLFVIGLITRDEEFIKVEPDE